MVQVDVGRLPGTAQKILTGGAPPPARLMAASGIIPGLKPGDVVTVVAALTADEDGRVAAKAKDTIAKLPPPLLKGALGADLERDVITVLCEAFPTDAEVVPSLLRMKAIGGDALEILAERANEAIGEIVATNEARLLEHPTVIEKLYMNKNVRMSTADRILELAVRNGLELGIPAFKEAAAAIQNELIPEATEEPTFEDQLFAEVEATAKAAAIDAAADDTHEVDDEGKEQVKEILLPLHARIAEMTVSQKIRRAMLGTSAERLLLVRDTNRLVSSAAAQSPMLNENEAARIAASRQVSEDVLRIIARNKEFTRSYQVKLNLINNPRTPFTFSARLIPHLRDNDVRSLSKSKNVSSNVKTACRQLLLKKQGKKS